MDRPIKVHTLRGYIQSMFLIEYPDKLLLFDSGTKVDVGLVFDFIENELGRERSDLKLVAVSHVHPDHSGGAAYFQRQGIPIAGNPESNRWYGGFVGFFVYLIDILLTYFVWSKRKKSGDKIRNIFFPRYLKYDYDISKSETLPLFEDWQVLKTPGHTHYDLSFYNESSGHCYVADNLIARTKGYLCPYPIINPEAYRSSLRTYLEIGPKTILMAHYKDKEFKKEHLEDLLKIAPLESRSHRNSLGGILWSFVKKVF